MKLLTKLVLVTVLAGLLGCCSVMKPRGRTGWISSRASFNQGWKFRRLDPGMIERPRRFVSPAFDDSAWEDAILPHSARIEPLFANRHFQGICWYRKRFTLDSSFAGKKLYLDFEGAMHTAEVWINGVKVLTHEGGYLPFTADLTPHANFDGENLVAVRLDNRDDPEVPPGRPLRKLDFCYFGGLYRDGWLRVTEAVHITDPVAADEVAGGGIFVTYGDVSERSARVKVRVHVRNEGGAVTATVMNQLIDEGGRVVAQNTSSSEISASSARYFETELTVDSPRLWSPARPNLYTLRTRLLVGDREIEEAGTRVGIRRIEFRSPDGFYLNGQKILIIGTNRHQEYPYLGNAVSDHAQYRDARKIKEAGFNLVRLSHYPHSTAFMDACDELGLMTIVETPGWQHWKNTERFRQNVLQNVQDMVRRDRNHPSAILWEVTLNETSAEPDDFVRECHLAAHAEYPGDQFFTCGDTDGRKDPSAIGLDVPYAQWDRATFRQGMFDLARMGYPREGGDYLFGGNNSTSRAFRGDGEAALLLQAWNYQWSLNRTLAQPLLYGSGMWTSIDYNRGYYPKKPIAACGAMDIFRRPKFMYYFFQSQRDPAVIMPHVDSGPMVFIANYWTPRESPAKVVVYSNCEQVELYLKEKLIERRRPDHEPDTDYAARPESGADPAYWMKGENLWQKVKGWFDRLTGKLPILQPDAFDGGNAIHLPHPPFTFTVDFQPGELKAVGLIKDEVAALAIRRTPEAPKSLRLLADLSGSALQADGADAVFIHAEVIDENGTVVPDASPAVRFTVTGPAELIGPNPVPAEAGIATTVLRAEATPGEIKVTAESTGLSSDTIKLSSLQ